MPALVKTVVGQIEIMKSKQFKNLKGWVDYDRPYLTTLTYKQKVTWFRRRLNLILIKPLKYVYRGVSRSSKQSALLIFATSICCAIEAMGKFFSGGHGNKHEHFREFLKEFMNGDFMNRNINGMTYETILWKYFRNGLAHGFAICHGGFEHQTVYFLEKTISGKCMLYIDPQHFLNDFVSGVKQYLDVLQKAPVGDKVAQDFEKIFKEVFIDGK